MEIKKKFPIYYASSDDLDRKLGNWVNNHHEKDQLKQFKRETEGRYQYGGKRVKIHEENGELVVTSGRKIMPIDYFVQNFD